MNLHLFDSFLMLVTLVAAGAVAVVCALGLVVWMAGGRRHSRVK